MRTAPRRTSAGLVLIELLIIIVVLGIGAACVFFALTGAGTTPSSHHAAQHVPCVQS